MKRYLAIGGMILALVAAVWIGRDRGDGGGRSSAARPEDPASTLRWSGGAGGDASQEDLAPRRMQAGAISGRVIDAIDGHPIEGAIVTLRSGDGEELEEVWSDPDGTFSFEQAGTAEIVAASAPGYAIRARPLVFTGEIVLELDGAVFVSGIVVSAGGDAVADAEVWVEDTERRWMHPPTVSGSVRTDAEGRFEIEDSPSGSLVVHASHAAHAPASAELGGLGPGRRKEGVRVELGDTGALSGRVVDEKGTPVAGAAMTWIRDERMRWREGEVTATADGEGRFRFPHLPVGKGLVRAMTSSADGAAEASITAGGEVSADVTVIGEPVFSGVVVDRADQPVSGATVSVGFGWDDENEDAGPLARVQRRGGETWESVTDAQGRFAVHAPARGEVTLSAWTPVASGRVTGVSPGDPPVQIRVEAMGVARIRLVGDDGQTYRGNARVHVRHRLEGGTARRSWDIRDGSGETTFTAEPGEWRFRVQIDGEELDGDSGGGGDEGALSAERRETVVTVAAAPPETRVTLRVRAPAQALGTVRGRIVGPDGAAVPGARISLLNESRDWGGARGARLDWRAAVRSDAAGRFVLQAPPGTQKLFVYHPEFRTELATVVVPAEAETDAGVIRLDAGTGASAVFEFSGIGAILSLDARDRCQIRDVVAEGPAQRAGLRAKDVILQIDGAPLHGMSLGDAVDRIRGPVGTTVTLLVEREGNLEPFVIDVVREKIRA